MIGPLLLLLLGLALLIVSADRFVFGAAALANNLRVSPLLVGVIVVGFGTSAPEMLVSALAAWQGNPSLAIGNAIGSNISNIALILGVAALVRPLTVCSAVLRRELPVLLAATLASWILLSNGRIDFIDGVLLMAAFFAMLYWMVTVAQRGRAEEEPLLQGVDLDAAPAAVSNRRAALWLVVGLVVLLLSARLLVWAAVELAEAAGISELVVGLTVVAVGTSLPELATAITAALRRQDDMVIGNIIGSNIFNLLAVLSLPGLIAGGPFPPEVLVRDVPAMVALTLALFVMSYGSGVEGRVNRVEGAVLLAAFAGYQGLVFGAVP